MQTRKDNIDIDKKKRNGLLSFPYWLRRFQSHYRRLAKRLICFSRSLVKSEFRGFENPRVKRQKSPPAPCRQGLRSEGPRAQDPAPRDGAPPLSARGRCGAAACPGAASPPAPLRAAPWVPSGRRGPAPRSTEMRGGAGRAPPCCAACDACGSSRGERGRAGRLERGLGYGASEEGEPMVGFFSPRLLCGLRVGEMGAWQPRGAAALLAEFKSSLGIRTTTSWVTSCASPMEVEQPSPNPNPQPH